MISLENLSLQKQPFFLAPRRWDVLRGGTSAIHSQKFPTYDLKSVQNLVINR